MNYEHYQQLRKEIKEQGQKEALNKKNVLILQAHWKEEQLQICVKCGRTENLTLDHIIPIELTKSFGIDLTKTYWEDDYQLMCGICNKFKGHNLDFANPKTKQLLLKLLEKI